MPAWPRAGNVTSKHHLSSLALLATLCLGVATFASDAGASPGSGRVDLRKAKLDTAHGKAFAPSPDGNVQVTLDPALQREALKLLEQSKAKEGAIVLSDVRTGRILAWASRGGDSDWVATARAPSASLFKVATAAALLDRGRVTPTTRQCYAGGERKLENEDLVDDKTRDDHCVSFGEALGFSINAVIARMALKHLAPAELRETSSALGFGSGVPIDLHVPHGNIKIPDEPFAFARAAAGFWNGHTSPLEALFMMQTIANQGERVHLHVLGDPDSVVRESDGAAMRPATARSLTRMLQVTTRTGTSAKAFHKADGGSYFPKMSVAGKTGTLIGGHPTRMFSWFAGFAPARKPEVAISVMLGNDVKWWKKGNEVAREMLQAYFGDAGAQARHRIRSESVR